MSDSAKEKKSPKVQTTVRLDPDIAERFDTWARAQGTFGNRPSKDSLIQRANRRSGKIISTTKDQPTSTDKE